MTGAATSPALTHVAALSDFDRCASRIVRRFVRTLDAGDTSCAGEYNEMRLVDRFVHSSKGLEWGTERRKTARIAAATLGDVIARWFGMYTYSGTGLRGGDFTTTDGPMVRWRLKRVRWVRDVMVSGTASWDRRTGRIRANLTVDGKGAKPGGLRLRWNDRHRHAEAVATGRLGRAAVSFSFPAP